MIRVLLDEDLPIRFRHHFPEGTEVQTVQYRGWKGLKNGALLRAVTESKAFDVLVTMDTHLPDQQNLARFDLSVVILQARSKRLADLVALMPELEQRLPHLERGVVIRIFAAGQR